MTKKNLGKVWFSLLIFWTWIIIWLRSVYYLDPDFGWHLRMGQIILSFGVPKTDPFSYSMPSFPAVDSSWLVGVLLAKLEPLVGVSGLACLFSLITLAALALPIWWGSTYSSSKIRIDYWQKSLYLWATVVILPFTGIRPQVFSWFFLGLWPWLLLDKALFSKWKFILPILMVIWVNLHGSFVVGIILLFIKVLFDLCQKRRTLYSSLFIFGLAFAATLINPYGLRMWEEVWRTVSDPLLRQVIVEWKPTLLNYYHLPFWVLVVLSGILLWKFWSRFAWLEKFFWILLFAQTLTGQRHLPLWLMIGIPFIFKGLNYLAQEIKRIKDGLLRLNFASKCFLISAGVTLVFLLSVLSLDLVNFKSEIYPAKAVGYLKNNFFSGEILSRYDWGGFLVWQLPERKVYFDGWMPTWRWENCPSKESCYGLREYLDLVEGKIPYRQVFDKYNVGIVLWRKSDESWWLKKLPFLKFLVFRSNDDVFLDRLKADGWPVVYEDQLSIIYKRPQ